MNRIKVGHITTVDISLRYLLLNQLRSIGQAGYDVVGISSPGYEVCAIEAAGLPHISISMNRNFTPMAELFSLCRLYWIIRKEYLTLVPTHNPKPGLRGEIAAGMANVPVIINTLHVFYFHDRTHPAARRFRRMGKEGRHMSMERFDERLVFKKVKEEYRRLLREKGLPLPALETISEMR